TESGAPPSSIAELEAVFLRMNSPRDIQQRRRMLHDLQKPGPADTTALRAQLLEWIDRNGLDYETGMPGIDLTLEDDSP
ncbi:MAG: hypothetical protein K0V04_21145, partial [Deltaproteobacteria bacterium]|nr:hypothetical protein [Deltaproteobacteria bacterium]